jgi:hypothetical protein
MQLGRWLKNLFNAFSPGFLPPMREGDGVTLDAAALAAEYRRSRACG